MKPSDADDELFNERTRALTMMVGKEQRLVRTEREPDALDLVRAVIEKGLTSESVAAVAELVKLRESMEARKAEKEFAMAFVQLQKDLPTIMGARGIPDKQGNIKFRYANFEDIDSIVRPICLAHGFSYAFKETGIESGRITVTMILQHSGGHLREIPYSVRIGNGPPGSTESQADVSGHSYAQRGALESGLALRIVGTREDARGESGPVSEEIAFELERRCKETNSDVIAFLKFAGATSFKTIAASKYDMLDNLLTKKERQ